MNHLIYATALAAALILTHSISEAGVNKCTDAAGVVSYSDQPCSVKEGHKPAEFKNAKEFAVYAAREHERKIGRRCTFLREKTRDCHSSIASSVKEVFDANCEVPIKREYLETQRELREQSERTRTGRYYRHREDQERQDELTQPKMSCGELQSEMWDFVKEKFGDKLTAKEIKAIEYNLIAIPRDDNESYNSYRRRRN